MFFIIVHLKILFLAIQLKNNIKRTFLKLDQKQPHSQLHSIFVKQQMMMLIYIQFSFPKYSTSFYVSIL